MVINLFLLVFLGSFEMNSAEGIIGDLARTVARSALAGGLGAATGMQPAPVATPATLPQTAAPAGRTAGNENNPLANSAATKLESVSKDLRNALEANPFFKLAGLGMQIRELATANPEALKGAGVYIVYAPKPEEEEDPRKKAEAQGVLDIAMGIDSPAASLQHKKEKQAENELSAMMSSGNQEDLERTMSPQERMGYDQQRIAQLRHEIGIQRKTVERARALIAKKAARREQ